MVSYPWNVGLCFSQICFHFIINTSSFINLNRFPETDPGSRNISQCGRQDCQQRWGCIFKEKSICQDVVYGENKFGGLKLLYPNEGYDADLTFGDCDALKYPYRAVSLVGLDTVFMRGRLSFHPSFRQIASLWP